MIVPKDMTKKLLICNTCKECTVRECEGVCEGVWEGMSVRAMIQYIGEHICVKEYV